MFTQPLENFHAAKTFEILRKEEKNFLQNMDIETFYVFKKNVIHNILNTDMKQHFCLLEKFRQWTHLPKDHAIQQVEVLTAMIVHTSDFGGAVKTFQTSKEWSRRVNIEFSKQYEKEGELGIPQTPMMKGLNNIETWAGNEMGFMRVIVLPLYL